MPIEAKFVHTNIVARDWRGLAKFYQDVFGCAPLAPERNYRGPWLRDVTGIDDDVTIRGLHLRLPGYGDGGPTLEIFEYDKQPDVPPHAVNQRGFAHIAFHVADVTAARDAVLAAGGADLGQIHTMLVPAAGNITLVYMTDPEGNIIELQHWTPAASRVGASNQLADE